MQELLAEVAAEAATLVAYTLLATLLSALGLFAERASLATFGTGDLQMALWYGFVGLLLLAGAGLLVRDRILPRVRTRLA
jgi:hypothetical protein